MFEADFIISVPIFRGTDDRPMITIVTNTILAKRTHFLVV
jgi:hypothetical protein